MSHDNTDAASPIGVEEQGMKFLSEMDSMIDEHDQFVKSLAARVDVL